MENDELLRVTSLWVKKFISEKGRRPTARERGNFFAIQIQPLIEELDAIMIAKAEEAKMKWDGTFGKVM